MGQAALADFLTDFGARPRVVPSSIAAVVPSSREIKQPAIDIDAEIARAVSTAEAELERRLDEIYDARLADMQATHEASIRDLNARLGTELGAQIAATLAATEQNLVAVLTAGAARVLAHITTEAMTSRAVAELAQAVTDALGDAEAVRVRVRGPQSLFLPLTVAMGPRSRHLEYTETDSADLSVSIDETLFETRIADWSRALDGILG